MTDIAIANFIHNLHCLFLVFLVICIPLFFWKRIRPYIWALMAVTFLSQVFWGVCPLTLIEEHYRNRGGENFSYGGSFVSYYVRQFFGVRVAPWVVTASLVVLAPLCAFLAYVFERVAKKRTKYTD